MIVSELKATEEISPITVLIRRARKKFFDIWIHWINAVPEFPKVKVVSISQKKDRDRKTYLAKVQYATFSESDDIFERLGKIEERDVRINEKMYNSLNGNLPKEMWIFSRRVIIPRNQYNFIPYVTYWLTSAKVTIDRFSRLYKLAEGCDQKRYVVEDHPVHVEELLRSYEQQASQKN